MQRISDESRRNRQGRCREHENRPEIPQEVPARQHHRRLEDQDRQEDVDHDRLESFSLEAVHERKDVIAADPGEKESPNGKQNGDRYTPAASHDADDHRPR